METDQLYLTRKDIIIGMKNKGTCAIDACIYNKQWLMAVGRLINLRDFSDKQNLLNLNFGLPRWNIDDRRFRALSLFRAFSETYSRPDVNSHSE